MYKKIALWVVAIGLFVVGCTPLKRMILGDDAGDESDAGQTRGDASDDKTDAGTPLKLTLIDGGPVAVGLQPNGSIALVLEKVTRTSQKLVPLDHSATAGERGAGIGNFTTEAEFFEIASALVPSTEIFSFAPSDDYVGAAAALVATEGVVMTFDQLSTACHGKADSASPMTLLEGGAPSPEEVVSKINTVIQCGFPNDHRMAYWPVELVDKIDVCSVAMGSGWRMPTEADLAQLSEGHYNILNGIESTIRTNADFGNFVFSNHVFVRADGLIKMADIRGKSAKITDGNWQNAKSVAPPASDGTITVLRCIRRRPVKVEIAPVP